MFSFSNTFDSYIIYQIFNYNHIPNLIVYKFPFVQIMRNIVTNKNKFYIRGIYQSSLDECVHSSTTLMEDKHFHLLFLITWLNSDFLLILIKMVQILGKKLI